MYIKFEAMGIKRSPLLYVSADNREITMANKWASVLFNLPKEKLIGKNFFFWIDKQHTDFDTIQQLTDDVFKKKRNWRGFVRGIRGDDFFWVELSATYMPDNNEFSIVLNEPSELDLERLLKES